MSETIANETEDVTYFQFLFDFLSSEKEEQKLFTVLMTSLTKI